MNTSSSHPALTWKAGRRQRAWQLHQQGWTQCQIATALGVSQGAVSQWVQRAQVQGVAALAARSSPGRPPALNTAQLQHLVELLQQGAEAFGFRGAVWTTRRVARLIADQFGVQYHPAHVSRLLRRLDWTPQKPILRATQRDEAAIAGWFKTRWPAIKKKRNAKAAPSSG